MLILYLIVILARLPGCLIWRQKVLFKNCKNTVEFSTANCGFLQSNKIYAQTKLQSA